jgi:hypothetical protein
MYATGASILAVLSALLLSGTAVQDPPPVHDPVSEAASSPRLFLAAGLFALAVLYHQANVLFALPLAAYLISSRGKAGLKQWLWIVGAAGAATLAVYILAYLAAVPSPSAAGFIRFCLSYTSEICLGGQCKTSPDTWGSLSNLSPEGLRQLLSSLAWNITVLPPGLEGAAGLLLGLGLLALSAWHILRILRPRILRPRIVRPRIVRPRSMRSRILQRAGAIPLRVFSLVWILSYTLFFFWWLPSYQHPFVSLLVPLLLLAVLALQDVSKRWQAAGEQQPGPHIQKWAAAGLALVALALAARNFQARILPLHRSPGDAFFEAAGLQSLAPQDCAILTSYRTWNHLRYYFDREMVFQVRHPMSFIYQGEPVPSAYEIAGEPCVFVSSTFLNPAYTNEDFEEGVLNGYQAPTQWLSFITWVFDMDGEDPGVSVSYRDFQIVHLAEGDPYIRLLPGRSSQETLAGLFERLDAGLQEPDDPFQSWYLANR